MSSTFTFFFIFLISSLLITCLIPSYLGVPLGYAGFSINKIGVPESASSAHREVFLCDLERRAKCKLLKLKLLHKFKFNMTLILVLQIYFIVSSTGEDWQTINIYNKMVVPDMVYTTENASVTIYCGSSSPVTWTYLPAHHSNGPYSLNLDVHTAGTNQITLNKLLEKRFWYLLLQRSTRLASFYCFRINNSL